MRSFSRGIMTANGKKKKRDIIMQIFTAAHEPMLLCHVLRRIKKKKKPGWLKKLRQIHFSLRVIGVNKNLIETSQEGRRNPITRLSLFYLT